MCPASSQLVKDFEYSHCAGPHDIPSTYIHFNPAKKLLTHTRYLFAELKYLVQLLLSWVLLCVSLNALAYTA